MMNFVSHLKDILCPPLAWVPFEINVNESNFSHKIPMLVNLKEWAGYSSIKSVLAHFLLKVIVTRAV